MQTTKSGWTVGQRKRYCNFADYLCCLPIFLAKVSLPYFPSRHESTHAFVMFRILNFLVWFGFVPFKILKRLSLKQLGDCYQIFQVGEWFSGQLTIWWRQSLGVTFHFLRNARKSVSGPLNRCWNWRMLETVWGEVRPGSKWVPARNSRTNSMLETFNAKSLFLGIRTILPYKYSRRLSRPCLS